MKIALLKNEGNPVLPEYFPTLMQAVVFKNWDMVEKEKIAEVLETDTQTIEMLANGMGLAPQKNMSEWKSRGYISIIRANWHLLNYEQLLVLLDWSEEKLAMVLKEEDFLGEKLGNVKPVCEKIVYRPLSKSEEEQTRKIKSVMMSLEEETKDCQKRAEFDFYFEEKGKQAYQTAFEIENTTGESLADSAAERFFEELKQSAGAKSFENRKLILKYEADKKEEYHEICVKEKEITLAAGGYGGIIRGLYRLLDMAECGGIKSGKRAWEPRLNVRAIYPFSAAYNDIFEGEGEVFCPDSLFAKYARVGINGIWLPAILYRMTHFPFAPNLSEGWEKRTENLRNIAKRAAAYGIKIYLYLNEPRNMPLEVFRQHPDMRGTRRANNAAMCIQSEKTRAYLENAMESLCKSVPQLGGFFIISMCENLTLCKSKPENFYDEACPHCKDIPAWQAAAQMHEVLLRGMKKAAPHMKMMFFDWGWDRADLGMEPPSGTQMCIKLLPEEAILLCQRETDMEFSKGGITNRVHDYALSINGVSPRTLKHWQWAKESGHKIAGKLQLNNSWECSAVPYLPMLQRNIEQVEAMENAGVEEIFFSWTLGGYPSPNISLVSETFFKSDCEKTDYKAKLRAMYGENSEKIWQASEHFSNAFEHYPFDCGFIYCGPSNAGVGNVFYEKPTGAKATMTCYAFDDLETWSQIYPPEVLENQYKLLCDEWKKGLEVLTDISGEFRDMAVAAYIQLRSSYNHIRFIRLRDRYIAGDVSVKETINYILGIEEKLALEMYKIMLRQPAVGFEAANHYYISRSNVAEKLVNIEHLRRYYA